MTDIQKEQIRTTMLNEWADDEKRAKRIENMRKAADRRRKHKDIPYHQLDNDEARRAYQREYQKKFRLAHPDYYNKYYTKKKQKQFLETEITDTKSSSTAVEMNK